MHLWRVVSSEVQYLHSKYHRAWWSITFHQILAFGCVQLIEWDCDWFQSTPDLLSCKSFYWAPTMCLGSSQVQLLSSTTLLRQLVIINVCNCTPLKCLLMSLSGLKQRPGRTLGGNSWSFVNTTIRSPWCHSLLGGLGSVFHLLADRKCSDHFIFMNGWVCTGAYSGLFSFCLVWISFLVTCSWA